MNADQIIGCFSFSSQSTELEALFNSLNTLRRPFLPDDEKHRYHDWTLIRKAGIELGFADSEYHHGAARHRWGHGDLILTQVYFYTSFYNVTRFAGKLPLGLSFIDGRTATQQKLLSTATNLHSGKTDTWDIANHRMNVTYSEDESSIDKIFYSVAAAPIANDSSLRPPAMENLIAALGCKVTSDEFSTLWKPNFHLDYNAADDEIELLDTFGVSIGVSGDDTTPRFKSITFHRNRDRGSVGWNGSLPNNLDFEDSPNTLFHKLSTDTLQVGDTALTGFGVWDFPDYTLHVLYSNVDNRVLRVKLIAPGTWKCVEDS